MTNESKFTSTKPEDARFAAFCKAYNGSTEMAQARASIQERVNGLKRMEALQQLNSAPQMQSTNKAPKLH